MKWPVGIKIRTRITDVSVFRCGPAGLLGALDPRKTGLRVIAMDKGIIGNDPSTFGAKQLAATGPLSVTGDGGKRKLRKPPSTP